MDKVEEEYKYKIGILLAGMIEALKMQNANAKALDEAEMILTALTTISFEYGMFSAEKDKKQMS